MCEVRFLGHAAVQLKAGEAILFADLWLDGNSSRPVVSAADGQGEVRGR